MEPVIQKFMWVAQSLNMTGPDFVYIFFALVPIPWVTRPWITGQEHVLNISDADMKYRKDAFKSFRTVSCGRVLTSSIERLCIYMTSIFVDGIKGAYWVNPCVVLMWYSLSCVSEVHICHVT